MVISTPYPLIVRDYVKILYFHPIDYRVRMISFIKRKAKILRQDGKWEELHLKDAINELIDNAIKFLEKNEERPGILTSEGRHITQALVLEMFRNQDAEIARANELAKIDVDF